MVRQDDDDCSVSYLPSFLRRWNDDVADLAKVRQEYSPHPHIGLYAVNVRQSSVDLHFFDGHVLDWPYRATLESLGEVKSGVHALLLVDIEDFEHVLFRPAE